MLTARIIRKTLCYWSSCLSIKRRFKGNKEIFLTFDDGPDPTHSNRIMDLLAKYDIKATFFLIGAKIENNKDTVRRMVREGHVLGNHTNTHKVFPHISMKERMQEIEGCQNEIKTLTNSTNRFFRPPQGLINPFDVVYLLINKYKIMLWTIDSNDHCFSDDIETRLSFLNRTQNVILFHDDNAFCIDALTKLIPIWIDQGFNFAVPKYDE